MLLLRIAPVLESVCNKVADLQTSNFINKRLQHRSFPVNIAESLRTPILKIIWKRLLLPLEVGLCFGEISYENALFGILEDYMASLSIS